MPEEDNTAKETATKPVKAVKTKAKLAINSAETPVAAKIRDAPATKISIDPSKINEEVIRNAASGTVKVGTPVGSAENVKKEPAPVENKSPSEAPTVPANPKTGTIDGASSATATQSSNGKASADEMYSDIAEILSNLGEGLANAQRQLDISALMTQKQILEDDVLSGYGLSANWYVIPELEFTLKITLSVVTQQTEDGTKRVRRTRLFATPLNAKYNNLYKSEKTEESTLRVRFVPVPMPTVIKIPNLLGSTTDSAKKTLLGAAIKYSFIGEDGSAWNKETGIVVAQSTAGGEIMLADNTLVVTVKE
ncbi:hypothetical protein Mpt1_c01430 [Candidatus Methanoplasma termitum]|uniref:PASTA domain-containing protein n=1 Tax=Candidatus Methanoplasma termitum TaxID=1577791 RepID=A0A0A7LEV9_9ARCH|nr:PASTA domain-containing protein [Candidatus Methanoplasma termitum]AIZ56046.1 hypothetical protein Mpt1_c01430 [Candidatus Methanoplasma termitum]